MEERDLIYLYFGFWTRFVMQIMFLLRKHIHLTLGLALLSINGGYFSDLMLTPPFSSPPTAFMDIHCMTRDHH